MRKILLLLVLLLLTSPGLAQQESIPLTWEPVPGADGYRVFYSPLELTCPDGVVTGTTPARSVDVGAQAYQGFLLTGLQANTEYWVTVKALLSGRESAGCATLQGGRVGHFIVGWPTPRIEALETTFPQYVGPDTWEISVYITGANFRTDPGDQAVVVNYPGLSMIGSVALDEKTLRVVLHYTRSTPGGTVEIWLINNDGTTCDYRPEAEYAGCVKVLAGTVEIVPIALPGDVTGLNWWIR